MSLFGKIIILLRAITRLSLPMVLFMVRRLLRNRLAVKFPNWYRSRIAKIEHNLPDIGTPAQISSGLSGVTDFYCAEYSHLTEGVLKGNISLHGRAINFGGPSKVDWNHYVPEEGDHQMWRVKLAHMGFICPMLLAKDPAHQTAVAELVLGARQQTSPTDVGAFNAYWFPYAASHRILAIGSGLLSARAKGTVSPDTDAQVVKLLRENVAFLLDNIEYELYNNHVERNLAALCLYFSYVDRAPERIVKLLERDIDRFIDRTILPDGTQIERSPMYQGLSAVSLAMMAETPFLSSKLRYKLANIAEASRRAFALLCHPDGEVALFNDAWHGEVPKWTGAPAPDGRSLLAVAGYGRLSQGKDVCIMDAGPLGPKWNPGHGHADFLSMEITLKARRVIVDPGTSRYNTGAERARERSAAAHNGPIWQGLEPVDFLGCFKVGRMAEAHLLAEKFLTDDTIAGLFNHREGKMGRLVRHYPKQGYLVCDFWDSAKTCGQVTWLIPGSWEITRGKSGFVLCDNVDGANVFIAPLSTIENTMPSASHWAYRYGHLEDAHELCFHPEIDTQSQYLLTWIGHTPAPKEAISDGANHLDQIKKIIKTT